MDLRDPFDNISPLDFRYWKKGASAILSENGFTRYKLAVERALVKAFAGRGVCPRDAAEEIYAACDAVTTDEVYAEERKTQHDIRALVHCIQKKVGDHAKPYVHLTATSYDIIDSANAAREKDAVTKLLLPALIELEQVLIAIALRESETIMVGRTHGQHAVPITFGFAVAGYVSRLGGAIQSLHHLAEKLPGKFSGAVGAYNAASLFFDDPEAFEKELLAELGLSPAEHSTQIIPPEPSLRLFCEMTLAAGIMANLADDMRHLQRTEIGEIGEAFEQTQIGSSTMPQKQNPISFENVKSLWKIVMPRMAMLFMDQISEHQRDLTNSASGRTRYEIIAYVVLMADRLAATMKKISVGRENAQRNIGVTKGQITAEPLYIILSRMGHPHAHETVLRMTRKAREEKRTLEDVASNDPELQTYIRRMTPRERKIIADPACYTGIAAKKARKIAERWKERLCLYI